MRLQDSNDGSLRIGRHSVDGDMLVLDPSLGSAPAANVTFFSLTHLRPRSFPRQIVESKIEEVTDDAQRASAEELYRTWPTLQAERALEVERTRAEDSARRRERILESHRRFVEATGVAFRGVQDSAVKVPPGSRRRARSSCQYCHTALDDFIGARCIGCSAVLCSCGACACAPASE